MFYVLSKRNVLVDFSCFDASGRACGRRDYYSRSSKKYVDLDLSHKSCKES